MTTSKDQPKTIVGDFISEVLRLFNGSGQWRRGVRFKFFFKPRPAPDAVNSLVPRGLDYPGARELRYARFLPLVHGNRKRLLGRLLCHLEVTKKTNQCSYDSSPI